MLNTVMPARRRLFAAAGAVFALSVVLLFAWQHPSSIQKWRASVAPSPATPEYSADLHRLDKPTLELLPHVETYFEQVFSEEHPKRYDYPGLKAACAHTKWRDDDVYIRCGGMQAGLTSIVSQIKVCLKMAVDTGAGLVLPAMPLRDSKNLKEFNLGNDDAYMTYDKWFDADHLREVMGRACPSMKIVHPDELDKSVPVKNKSKWEVSCANAWGYQKVHSYFWVGRPYRHFFEAQYYMLLLKDNEKPPGERRGDQGITVVDVDSEFLLFKITNDPTRRDLRLWNDLSHVVRFRPEPREIIARLMPKLTRAYYGVHFRVENDTIWSGFDNQLKVDLEMLDRIWEVQGKPEPRPLVYLACGDEGQVERFVAAGKERGWEVTHKWRLANGDDNTIKMINDLAFDFQGAIDMGIMVRSHFFMGIAGSAFSSTIANQRDIFGRYRGSSFEVADDDGARSHLFNDLDADEYACCL